MGLFSSKTKSSSSSSSTQTNNAWGPVKGVLETGASKMQRYLDDPNSTAVYGGPRVAPLSAATKAATGMMEGSRGANDAYGFFKNVMNSQVGGNNPAVAQMQDAIRRQVMSNVASQFSNSGTVGGTANQEVLARGLADGLAQPLFAAYENDMGRKMQAGQMLPGIDQQRINNMLGSGQIQDSYNQSKINADMKKFEEERTAPMRAFSEIFPMATEMGTRFGTQTADSNSSSVSKNSPGLGQQIMGGLMMGAGALTGMPMGSLGGLGSLFGGGGAPSAPWAMPSAPYASNPTFNLNTLFGGR